MSDPYPPAPAYAAVPWQALPLGAPPPRRSGVAVAALILSLVAMLGVVAVGVGLFLTSGYGTPGDDTVLSGHLAQAPGTDPVSSDDLAEQVSSVVEDDDWSVDQMSCPMTPRVRQGAVTVCHAQIEGDTWAVLVVFEDAQGRFVLDVV